MPSGLRETTKPHFEIYYEQPWGGVASDKDPVDIAPSQMVVQQGVLPVDNVLCQAALVADPNRFLFTPQAPGVEVVVALFELGGILYAVSNIGHMYKYQTTTMPNNFAPLTNATDSPWVPRSVCAVQVINGIAYIAAFDRNTIYTFDGTTFAVASTYTAGKVLGVLDDYLLQFNTNNATDGIRPNRINWSGPGKFSTWDPSVDRTAGFNDLAEINDQLVGFLSYASVGVAISEKGLIELSPTGIAIGPFTFTTLWTSVIGQGCTYPRTISQYGQRGFLASDSGVYSVSTGQGFKAIDGAAKKAILSSFQNSAFEGLPEGIGGTETFVAGSVFLYAFNSKYATPFYLLCMSLNQPILSCWFMDLETGVWSECIFSADTLYNAQYGTGETGGTIQAIQVNSFDLTEVENVSAQYPNPVTIITLTINYRGGLYNVLLTPYITNNVNDNPSVNIPTPLNLVFRQEELKLDRQPTFRRVIVKAYGSGTLTVSVNGIPFGDLVLDGTMTARNYKTPEGIYTGIDPQLTITSINFKGVIIKVMVAGTYADGDVD